MIMSEISFSEILGDFGSPAKDDSRTLKDGKPVTIWLPAKAKASYDRLQEKSGRRFSKKAREVLLTLIDIAESKTS